MAVGKHGIGKDIEARNGEQRDTEDRLAAKVLRLTEKMLEKKWNHRGQREAAPEGAGIEACPGGNSEEPRRKRAHDVPVIEIAKDGGLPQAIEGIVRWHPIPGRCLDKRD